MAIKIMQVLDINPLSVKVPVNFEKESNYYLQMRSNNQPDIYAKRSLPSAVKEHFILRFRKLLGSSFSFLENHDFNI